MHMHSTWQHPTSSQALSNNLPYSAEGMAGQANIEIKPLCFALVSFRFAGAERFEGRSGWGAAVRACDAT